MKRNYKKRVLPPWASSYAGRVHIPGITTKSKVFEGLPVYINSVCAGHVIVDESDMFGPDARDSQRKD